MIQAEQGAEAAQFAAYVERAVSKLAAGEYAAFVGMFDESRLSPEDVVFALRFLDGDRPVTRIDDPLAAGADKGGADLVEFRDGGGYALDYDLSTDGTWNDLTLSCEFLRAEGGWRVRFLDLRTP